MTISLGAIIFWILFGLLVGFIANIITGGKNSLLANTILGIIGALIGDYISKKVGYNGIEGFDTASVFTSVLGAILIISIANILSNK